MELKVFVRYRQFPQDKVVQLDLFKVEENDRLTYIESKKASYVDSSAFKVARELVEKLPYKNICSNSTIFSGVERVVFNSDGSIKGRD